MFVCANISKGVYAKYRNVSPKAHIKLLFTEQDMKSKLAYDQRTGVEASNRGQISHQSELPLSSLHTRHSKTSHTEFYEDHGG